MTIERVQREMGKAILLGAILHARPVPIRLPGSASAEVFVTYDAHPLVNRPGKWADLEHGTVRIRFSCPRCFRSVRKLFAYPLSGSGRLSELACRVCHRVTYISMNSGDTRLYREVVRRERQLERLRRKLSARRLPRSNRQILEAAAAILETELRDAKARHGRRSSGRRKWGLLLS